MSKNSKIFWTPGERDQVAEAAVKILRAYPKMPIFRAVGEAQQLLPPARQRRLMTAATIGEFKKEILRRLNTPVEHRIETGKYETAGSAPVTVDAISFAARVIAERFEQELRTALLQSAARVVKRAQDGEL